jgi:hypothetical protein
MPFLKIFFCEELEAIISVDSGTNTFWAARYFNIRNGRLQMRRIDDILSMLIHILLLSIS